MRTRSTMICLSLAALLVLPAASYLAEGPPETRPPRAASEAPPATRPVIELKETTYDFGSLMEDDSLDHAFEVRNTGTGDLVIEHVKPG